MPRYFVTVGNGSVHEDDEGLDLPDTKALDTTMRKTLAAMLHDEGIRSVDGTMTAFATDETGAIVRTMTLRLAVD